ncbi:MAG: pyridoxal-phosphate dependent enzyme [Armatimonadetes bacterium]|nr:pyridoxal-phosphate dependent enzyme [Armatimonadota bacterium]
MATQPAQTRPTFQDVLAAQRLVDRYLSRTPFHHYPGLSDLAGAEVWVKHENCQPIGAFKVRGGLSVVAGLTDEERGRGVICASTGNHGQAMAYASRLFGVRCIVGMPEGANPDKAASIRARGAEIIYHGRDFDDAREHVDRLAAEQGYRYVHSGNERYLIAGQATETLEILEAQPDVDVIVVPVGGGSGASGACIVAKAINPRIQVIGVQSEAAPAAYRSWKARRLVDAPCETLAEGLATRTAFALPQEILWDLLDDFVLVDEASLRRCVRLYLEKTHHLTEPAGAAPLAGALALRDRLAGKKVALIMSGGNVTVSQLRAILAEPDA